MLFAHDLDVLASEAQSLRLRRSPIGWGTYTEYGATGESEKRRVIEGTNFAEMCGNLVGHVKSIDL